MSAPTDIEQGEYLGTDPSVLSGRETAPTSSVNEGAAGGQIVDPAAAPGAETLA